MESSDYKENKQFPSGISKYGYNLYDNQYMFYIEFFEDSHQGNNPEYPDDRLFNRVNDPNNAYYEAFIYRIYKIEHIITKKTLKKYNKQNCGSKFTYKVGKISDGFIFYYRSYEAAINNKLSLKMFPKLYKNGISQYRKIYDQFGNLEKEYYHNNGKIEGLYIKYNINCDYYEDDTIEYTHYISETRNYMNGNLHGEWKFNNEYGQMIEYSLYQNNICIERYQNIYKDDKIYIKNIINYVNGKMEGKIKNYSMTDDSDDCIIYKETNYKNGKKNGINKKYINNELIQVSNYKDNKLFGYKLDDRFRTLNTNFYYSLYLSKIVNNDEVTIKEIKLDYNDKNIILVKFLFYMVIFANIIKLYKFI